MGFDPYTIAGEIAEKLLDTQAIKLSPQQPFQWSSGWLSPIYCDNRITLSYPGVRTFIKDSLAGLIRTQFPDAGGIAGVATAGIPQGALVADKLGLPFGYVRPEPKKHGMGNQIEGRIPEGSRIVMVEDLISTGGSSIKAAKALMERGVTVAGTVAVFSYGFQQAADNFKAAGIPLHVLSQYDTLISKALEKQYITPEQASLLSAWRKNPETWGK